jgi:hypothetical protein
VVQHSAYGDWLQAVQPGFNSQQKQGMYIRILQVEIHTLYIYMEDNIKMQLKNKLGQFFFCL